MPFILRRFTVSEPTSQFLCWSTIQGPLRFHIVQGASSPIGHSLHRYPLSAKEVERMTDEFVNSIDGDAVCRLASQHNEGIDCEISNSDHGSFNICFFIRFRDDTTWVVRVPLSPVCFDPWTKIQSEVATMKYLESNTSVPVPHIWGYGKDAKLGKSDTQTMCFMIYEYLPGHPLTTRRLERTSKANRLRFFSELIDILVDLRRSEFPFAGSLMPNPDNDSEPTIGEIHTMASNELRINGRHPDGPRKLFKTEEEFIKYQYYLLSETYRMPCETLDLVQAKQEIFALHHLGEFLPQLLESYFKYGPFVLSHPDLRCSNIIVSEDFHILGVIDWEFTTTVPVLYATPPGWITGHGTSGLAFLDKDAICKDFYEALEAKSKISHRCRKLKHDWAYRPSLYFPLVQIFRFPDDLIEVHYHYLFRQLFDGEYQPIILDLFKGKDRQQLQDEVGHRVEESFHYQQNLVARGLLTLDEDDVRRRKMVVMF